MIVMANSLQTHISTWSDPGDVIPHLPPRDFVEDVSGGIIIRLTQQEYAEIMQGLDADMVTASEYAEALEQYLLEHPPIHLDGARVKSWKVQSLHPTWHEATLTVQEFVSIPFDGPSPD